MECLLICLASFSTFLVVNVQGVQGDGEAVPLYNIKSAVARWLHGSEDSMPQAEKTKNVS